MEYKKQMYKEQQHCRTRSKSLFGLEEGGGRKKKMKDMIFFWGKKNHIRFFDEDKRAANFNTSCL